MLFKKSNLQRVQKNKVPYEDCCEKCCKVLSKDSLANWDGNDNGGDDNFLAHTVPETLSAAHEVSHLTFTRDYSSFIDDKTEAEGS